MKAQSSRNFQKDQSLQNNITKQAKLSLKHSQSRIRVDQLNEIENNDFFLSKILCLHHVKTAFRYICDVNNDNILKYNNQYEDFMKTTKLKDIILDKNAKGQKINILNQALKLQICSIILVLLFCLMVGAASVVIIYYQQSLAKIIISKQPSQSYKYFGIIIGCIGFRFFIFNYLMALTNNIAINIKVGFQNLFIRAIFFIHSTNKQEINMHKLRYFAIQSFIEGIIFIPYAMIALQIIIGVVVLIFNLYGSYGFIFLGIFLFFLLVHFIILVFVFKRLQSNEAMKDKMTQQSKWVFRSLIPLIFDTIANKIIKKVLQIKDKSLKSDRFYNFSYTLTQFLADIAIVISFIIYYGITYNHAPDTGIKNTYLTTVYLGMLYFPFKIYVFGSFCVIRGFQQYYCMLDNFQQFLHGKKLYDSHMPVQQAKEHVYPDDIGICFNYSYEKSNLQRDQHLPHKDHRIKRAESNVFMNFQILSGQTVMVYFNTNNKDQIQRYIKQFINQLQFQKTIAIINQQNFILPQSFLENILFYSQFDSDKLHHILKLTQLDYFIPQIDKFGNNHLNYRVSKFYPWHSCRLELARALYNNVDYLIINKYLIIEDKKLLQDIIQYRKLQGKMTVIANNWNLELFQIADRCVFFEKESKQIGIYEQLKRNKDSLYNKIIRELRQNNQCISNSKQNINSHEDFIALVTKPQKQLQLQRKIYFQFFSFAHKGGFLVVLIALAAPISFKIYMNYLIGRSTQPGQQTYPDIMIFGLIYLGLILLRGFILSFYFRYASYELFQKMISKHQELCGDQILSIYKDKDQKIQNDFKKVDSNLVICFELGFSVILEAFGGFIIVGIGQPIVLAMALPLALLTAIVNFLYSRMQRNILKLRQRYQEQLKIFINHCTTKSMRLLKYGKIPQIQERFNQLHRIHILFACNQMWVLNGMRMIGEICIIIGVIIFLIIMIQTQSKQLTSLGMVSYGVSLFINMNFGYRFNLKTFSIIDSQTLAITKCINFFNRINDDVAGQQQKQVKEQKLLKKPVNIIKQIQYIQFSQVNIQFGKTEISNINLRLNKGQRISIDTDSRTLATLPFYLLKKHIFSHDHMSGSIIINGIQSSNDLNLDDLFYIHSRPLLPLHGSIYDICLSWSENLSRQKCSDYLRQFFDEVSLDEIFTIDTQITDLHSGYQQILAIFRVVKLENAKILVLISAFDYLDILTRIKIEKYLINLTRISLIITIASHPSIISLYPRKLRFEDHKFIESQSRSTSLQKLKNTQNQKIEREKHQKNQ